jgi:hypothetical protein
MSFHIDDSRRIAGHTWKGYGAPDEIKRFYLDAIKIFEQKGYKKWLCDNRKQPTLSPEIQEWAKSVFFPEALSAGVKFFAFVQPEGFIQGNTLKSVFNKDAPFQMEYFVTVDEATKWLEAMPE